jgi:hypothetical protein
MQIQRKIRSFPIYRQIIGFLLEILSDSRTLRQGTELVLPAIARTIGRKQEIGHDKTIGMSYYG